MSDGKAMVLSALIAAIASVSVAFITAKSTAEGTSKEVARTTAKDTATSTSERIAVKATAIEFQRQLEEQSRTIRQLKADIEHTRVLNRRVVETYYRPDKPNHFNRHNVKGIDKLKTGRYRVHLAEPFKNNLYIAVASNTAGFVRLTRNTKESIDLVSYSSSGQEIDAEVFFLAYGD